MSKKNSSNEQKIKVQMSKKIVQMSKKKCSNEQQK